MLGHEHAVGQDGTHDEHAEERGAVSRKVACRGDTTSEPHPWAPHHQAKAARSKRRGSQETHRGSAQSLPTPPLWGQTPALLHSL